MTAQNKPKTAIVVGAGAGGVALAARLAKAGLHVTVVEKNDFTGGRCSLIHHEGYRFDQGPSLFLLPDLFRATFADLGTDMASAGVDLARCDTNYNIWFHDNELFRHSSDLATMRDQILRWEGPDGYARFLAFLGEGHVHYQRSVDSILAQNYDSWSPMLSLCFNGDVVRLHPFESIWDRASRYFKTERLRRVFTFATMYMGMSPFDAPATYSLLQYTEFTEGIWYPRGGFHTVVQALVQLGKNMGVTYRMASPVRRVLTSPDGKTATGVVLQSGEQLHADIVAINADLVYAYSNLLPGGLAADAATAATTDANTPPPAATKAPSFMSSLLLNSARRWGQSLRKRDASCSSISFYWSVNRKVPELNTHNIFLAEEYRASFEEIFRGHSLPSDPSFYINVPSRVDPSAAPDGCDAIIALVPVGHLLHSQGYSPHGAAAEADEATRWRELVSRARAAVLSTIAARTGCASIEPSIVHEIVNTPSTWQSKFNLDKGAILGLSHNFANVLKFRPATRARGVRNTYFVGASTHPGTGVPIVLAGAKLTAEQILADAGLDVPWSKESVPTAAAASASSSSLGALEKNLSGTSKSLSSLDLKPSRRSWLSPRFGTEEVAVLLVVLVAFMATSYWPVLAGFLLGRATG